MAYNQLRKSGIPVLAYTTFDHTSALPCTLLIKYHHERKQATLSLQSLIAIHGFDEKQAFTIIYNADNLVDDATFLKPATPNLPQTQVAEVARHSDPQLTALSLTVKQPCPVWCPPSVRSINAKNNLDASFHRFVSLAKATDVHIVFDFKWLHRDFQDQFEEFINQPGDFLGFPIDQQDARHRVADWAAFGLTDGGSCGAPPAYAEASNKRPRTNSPSSTGLPPSKRLLQSTTPTSTPFLAQTTTTESMLGLLLASILEASAPGLQRPIEEALKKVLPDALKTILPDMVPHFFAISPSSPLLAEAASSPDKQRTSMPKPVSSLGNIVSAHVAAHAEAKLRDIHEEMVDHSHSLRSAADNEFLESVEEHKTDVQIIKNDGIADLQREIDDKLEAFREHAAEIVKEAAAQADQVYYEVCDKLNELAETTKQRLQSECQILGWGGPHMQVEKLREPVGSQTGDRKQRAKTAPL